MLKLAVQASASNVVGVDALRQGAGLINVNAAFDVYKRLAAEQRAAAADQTHRTPFAYELRAETNLPGLTLKGEGIHLKGVTSAADVKVKLTDASIALIDPLTFVEPVAP